MPHGYPDYRVSLGSISQYESDVAELAARLGSPDKVLRSGHVLYLDEFTEGANNWSLVTGFAAEAYITTVLAYSGSACLRLIPSANPLGVCYAEKHVPNYNQSIHGIECMIRFEATGALAATIANIWVDQQEAINKYWYAINIDPVNGTLEYLTGSAVPAAYTVLATGLTIPRPLPGKPTFVHFKLTMDFSTKKYSKLWFMNELYDMSSLDAGVYLTTQPGITRYILQANRNADVQPLDYDNVIITIDEPQ